MNIIKQVINLNITKSSFNTDTSNRILSSNSKKSATSVNTTLTYRRIRSSVTGDAFGREADSRDNPARLSLRPVSLRST
ncbi:hypothetical protein J40TS1_31730 [Paenibacillus montaniterrae]|uniref:Uncharacterized protein n=1 Tax=Paenibacillus montaniterrae TaxID=429341 RepID=A0A919YUI8_9BACL|nr:hypothetical protein J40TS1_31730 [Paenibacillus montaniterrae]